MNNFNMLRGRNLDGDFSDFFGHLGHAMKDVFTSKILGRLAFVAFALAALAVGAVANVGTIALGATGWIVGAVTAGKMIDKYSLSPRCAENDAADRLDYDHKLGMDCVMHSLGQLWGFVATTAVTTFTAETIYACASKVKCMLPSYSKIIYR
jgi:hypothetical protein